MTKCGVGCIPCCDFCKHAVHDEWDDEEFGHCKGGPIGCALHPDQEHQDSALGCGWCDDFYCIRAE